MQILIIKKTIIPVYLSERKNLPLNHKMNVIKTRNNLFVAYLCIESFNPKKIKISLFLIK